MLCPRHTGHGHGAGGDASVRAVGVSIRDWVLIGACCAQPRRIQYASNASNVVSSRSTIHFVAETYPYSPGTTIRTGKP